MQSAFERVDASLIAAGFAIAMLISWFLGWRRGRRISVAPGEDPDGKFIDASVVLLGLLLAFTFSISLQGHDQRRAAVVSESNAISDFYTCATLLKNPQRSELQGIIRDYARQLLKVPFEELTPEQVKQENQRCVQAYARMTLIVDQAESENPTIALALVNALNNVAGTNSLRIAAYRVRTPWSIVALLFVAALVPSLLIGEKQGARGKILFSGSLSFIVIVTAVIFVTLDLDQPHRGMIKVSRESLERVVQSM